MLVQFGRDPDGPRVNLTYLGGPIVTLDGIPTRSRSMHVCVSCAYVQVSVYVCEHEYVCVRLLRLGRLRSNAVDKMTRWSGQKPSLSGITIRCSGGHIKKVPSQNIIHQP